MDFSRKNYLKDLEHEINKKRQTNALYNQYLKDTGYTSAVRLYEDPSEVNFVPLGTQTIEADYNNELRQKLMEILGYKNEIRVIDIVDNRLNDIQKREMSQNWPTYEAFMKRYVRQNVSFERFVDELIDKINKNTAPVQILDQIGNLRITTSTSTTNPTGYIDPNAPIDPSKSKGDPNGPVEPSKPSKGNDDDNNDDNDDDADAPDSDPEEVKNLMLQVNALLKDPAVSYFFNTKQNKPFFQKIYKQKATTTNKSKIDTSKLDESYAKRLQKLFINDIKHSYDVVSEDDIYPDIFDTTRNELQIEYLTQLIKGLTAIKNFGIFDRPFMADKIIKAYEADLKNDEVSLKDMKNKYSERQLQTVNKKKKLQIKTDLPGLNSYYNRLLKCAIDDIYKIYENVTNEPMQKEAATAAEPTEQKSGSGLSRSKFYIDEKKFGKGVLEVRYSKNKHLLSDFKPIKMSVGLKNKINSEVLGGSVISDKQFQLSKEEQRVFNNLKRKFGMTVDNTEEVELMDTFDTIVGQINAGNDNPLLKQQLRSMLIYAMKTGAMSRNECLDYFIEFSL